MALKDPLLVDCRELPPPEPMVLVLEALEALPKGKKLLMRHRMRPVHLLPILTTRGFDYAFEIEEADLVELLIWHRDV
ncbi:MAG: DUF2249 domain-containing protein [bacterium]|nr:DUF2249 domain-containing protein [bacterium]